MAELPPFWQAARDGNVAVLTERLAAGQDVNQELPGEGVRGRTALMLAADNGHAEAVNFLMDYPGINPNLQDEMGYTALHDAIGTEDQGVVDAILGHPAVAVNVNLPTVSGDTPLHFAAEAGMLDTIVALRRRGADVATRNNDDETPADVAVNANVRRLIEAPLDQMVAVLAQIRAAPPPPPPAAPARPPPRAGWADEIFEAIEDLNVGDVRPLLEEPGADPNDRDDEGNTLLMLAVTAVGDDFRIAQIVSALLEAGADPNLTYPELNTTALMMAAQNNYWRTVSVLMANPATNPNLRSQRGATALMFALGAEEGDDALEAMLEPRPAGAAPVDLNVQDNDGRTALMKAAANNDLNSTFKLLEAGADPAIQNNANQTARDMANERGHANIVRLLDAPAAQRAAVLAQIQPVAPAAPADWLNNAVEAITRGNFGRLVELLAQADANPNARNAQGYTLLMLAATAPIDDGLASSLVAALLEARADPNLTGGPHDMTALMMAAQGNMADVVSELMNDPNTNPNIQTPLGSTALMFAVSAAAGGGGEALERMVEPRADGDPVNLNLQSNVSRTTALMKAAEAGLLNETFLLLEAGADPAIQNNVGQTARDIANARGHANIVRLLDARPDERAAIFQQIRNAGRGAAALGIAPVAPPPQPQLRAPAGAAAGPVDQADAFRRVDDALRRDTVDEKVIPFPAWLEPFKGTFEDDYVLLQYILDEPLNASICPICLGYVYRYDGCLYMHHDCRKVEDADGNFLGLSEKVYHQRLFNLYNIGGSIYWCGHCGRVCGGGGRGQVEGRNQVIGHQHYHLGPAQDAGRSDLHGAPGFYENVFGGGDNLCRRSGGGGFDEKFKRVNRLLQWALQIQSETGKMPQRDAIYQLIEETWNAPLFRDPDLEEVKATKKFSTPFEAFRKRTAQTEASDSKGPEGAEESKEEGPPPDIPKPADEAANVPEVVRPAEGQEFLMDADGNPRMDPVSLDDMREGIRFIHKRRNGVVYRHTDDELISRGGLTQWIQGVLAGGPKFGRCFLDDCDARLWPEDVQPYIPEDVFDAYRLAFNKRMRGIIGGAKKEYGITYVITNATGECPLPPRKGGKTYRRRRKTGKRKTYRRR